VVGGERAIFPVSLSVRFLDISVGGVLVESSQPAKQGGRGRLRLDLGGRPFSAEVEVRRVATAPGGAGYKIGAQFVDLSAELRQVIEDFTHR
jgi:hypothetical protein